MGPCLLSSDRHHQLARGLRRLGRASEVQEVLARGFYISLYVSELSYLAKEHLMCLSSRKKLSSDRLVRSSHIDPFSLTLPPVGRQGGKVCGVPVAGRRRSLGLLAARADCVRTPPLQLQPCSPIRLVTGLRPPPRPENRKRPRFLDKR